MQYLLHAAEPLMHISFCLDKPILAGFLESFAPCPVSALAGRYDDEDLICLTRRAVNTPNPAMQSERVDKRSREYHGDTNLATVGSEADGATVAVQASVSSWLTSSPDHLIGLEEEGRGDSEAERLSRLEVDHQLGLRRPLNR